MPAWGAIVSAAGVLALSASVASAQPGSDKQPIVVHMRAGSDAAILKGVLRNGADCCTYVFKAHAGQTLHWKFSRGPTVRILLTYPDGHTDNYTGEPGGSGEAVLPAEGAYVFALSGDTNADNAFGRYVLTLRIPPR